jgi:hypothetical protein
MPKSASQKEARPRDDVGATVRSRERTALRYSDKGEESTVEENVTIKL